MKKFAFLNYGGPGGYWLTQSPQRALELIDACQKFYVGGQKFYKQDSYLIKGIQATVHSFGIHRALTLELPELPQPSQETIKNFEQLVRIAEEFTDKEYSILSNNCVTAVATIMNLLDRNTTKANVTMPWSLDKQLQRYWEHYGSSSVEGRFLQKYQELLSRDRDNHPTNVQKKTKTIHEIILAAYSGNKEEKTKASLLELGWIIEVDDILLPTENAPEEFIYGLQEFNKMQQKAQQKGVDLVVAFKERLHDLESKNDDNEHISTPRTPS